MKKTEEVEVKIAVAGARGTRTLLKARGFAVLHARVFEQNIALDDPEHSIRARHLLLRVRSAGKVVTVTFKGKEAPGIFKRREEREFRASSLEDCLGVFSGLGFEPSLRYEKYRTEFVRADEPGHVTLDETPIGVFMELEGPARWIDRTAKDLGFSRDHYIRLSYARLFERWCAERGIESTNMRFGDPTLA